MSGCPLSPCRRAERTRRARVRHLLAPAQRAHHLPWHRDRRQIANLIVAQMLHLQSQDPDKDISMYINSPGGSIYSGLAIYDTMHFIKPDVSTMCMGIAMSMGSLLLMAGVKGKRFALPTAGSSSISRRWASRASPRTSRSRRGRSSRRARDRRDLRPPHRPPGAGVHRDMERDRFFKPARVHRVRPIDRVLDTH